MDKKLIGSIMATAIAGAMTAGVAMAKGTFKCEGGNACKGKSACKSGDHSCKGQNACKGKGVEMTKDEKACEADKKKNAPAEGGETK